MWGGKTSLDVDCFRFQGERVKVKAIAFAACREQGAVTCREGQHFRQFGTVQGMTGCLVCPELLFFGLWDMRKWTRQHLTFPLQESFFGSLHSSRAPLCS